MADITQNEAMRVELPARGYPPSEEAVSNWFRARFGRDPTELALGVIIGAMEQREATKPQDASDAWIRGPAGMPHVHDRSLRAAAAGRDQVVPGWAVAAPRLGPGRPGRDRDRDRPARPAGGVA